MKDMNLIELSQRIIELNDERDEALEDEDYKLSFAIECEQRDVALTIAQLILTNQKKLDHV